MTEAENTTTKQIDAEEAKKLAAEANEQFEQLIATPLAKDEAEKALADLDVRRMQLTVIRQKWLAQVESIKQQANQVQQKIMALDEELYNTDLERAVIFRRTLNSIGTDEPTTEE